MEATAVLGAVAGFVVLLLALFLYLSRKWCFTPPSSTALFGGVCVPLCESTNSSTSQISKNIGTHDFSLYPDFHPILLGSFLTFRILKFLYILSLSAITILNLSNKFTRETDWSIIHYAGFSIWQIFVIYIFAVFFAVWITHNNHTTHTILSYRESIFLFGSRNKLRFRGRRSPTIKLAFTSSTRYVDHPSGGRTNDYCR